MPVGAEPDGRPVDLDVAVYTADGLDGPAPAVLLAHGFGGKRQDLVAQARRLAAEGYVVLTWTARGFGESGGRIHLNAPAYEVEDASALLDLLAARDDVLLDAAGDPRVGIAGGSYGGAIALLAAGYDAAGRRDRSADHVERPRGRRSSRSSRRRAIPARQRRSSPSAEPGVFKRLWAGVFFGSGSASADDPTDLRPVRRGRVRRVRRQRRDGSADAGDPRPARGLEPGVGARPDRGADAAAAGPGRLALPALGGRRQRTRHRSRRNPREARLVRRRPRRRRPGGRAPRRPHPRLVRPLPPRRRHTRRHPLRGDGAGGVAVRRTDRRRPAGARGGLRSRPRWRARAPARGAAVRRRPDRRGAGGREPRAGVEPAGSRRGRDHPAARFAARAARHPRAVGGVRDRAVRRALHAGGLGDRRRAGAHRCPRRDALRAAARRRPWGQRGRAAQPSRHDRAPRRRRRPRRAGGAAGRRARDPAGSRAAPRADHDRPGVRDAARRAHLRPRTRRRRRASRCRTCPSRRCRRTTRPAGGRSGGRRPAACSASASSPSPCVGRRRTPLARTSSPGSKTCRWSCATSGSRTPAASGRCPT